MTEPKLLTEAEARDLGRMGENERLALLCERGLIAPEPVDPLLIEAIELVVNDDVARTTAQTNAIREGRAGKEKVNLALAALRRGMELAERPTLTREMVREALVVARIYHLLPGNVEDNKIDLLHTALTGGDA